MKRALVCWLAAVAMATGADWRDDFHPLKEGSFPPPRPQTASYRFGWGAVSAADAEIEFSRVKKDELQLKLTTKTTGPVRAMWQLDAEHLSRCAVAPLRPIFLQQTEKYRKETEKTKVEFSPTEVARLGERVPADKTPPKTKRFKFPDVDDLQTALLLVRSQELIEGDRYSLVVYPSRAAYLARVEVKGREEIKVGGKTYPAVKLQLSLQRVSKDLRLEAHEKFKSAYAWLSDDADRLLLKIQAEVFVGSVWMELQSVKFTDEDAQRTQTPR